MQQLTAGANLVLAQPQCQIKIKTALKNCSTRIRELIWI